MRRISIEARAIKPRIKVSAAAIAWGRPPASLADFANVAPMQRVFQDWRGWLAEGLLDLAVPMNYAREHDDRVRTWFDGWIAWEKRHKAGPAAGRRGRRVPELAGIGAGAGRAGESQVGEGAGRWRVALLVLPAAPSGIFAAARRASRRADRSRRPRRRPLPRRPTPPAAAPAAAAAENAVAAPPLPQAAPDRLDFLVRGAGNAPGALARPAGVPPMPWIDHPTHGFIAGTVSDPNGAGIEGRTIHVRRTGWLRRTRRTTSDANGWFGMTGLAPGKYTVRLGDARGNPLPVRVDVVVTAGAVTRVALASK